MLFFLGYLYSRETLLLSGNYYQLEPQLKGFLSLYPVLNIDKKITTSLENIAPINIGYQLLFDFISSISMALAQRFTLLFAPQSSSIELPQSLFFISFTLYFGTRLCCALCLKIF
ncbi:hypothetical protein [Shigella sp. FC1967]|uniref:hypothetical protein n=1 Tax=Shigella sp. FC1967 TaxID=1898041 RepID=UPI0025701399|nr:hypothetical protein [Shigella sp. FC1967]